MSGDSMSKALAAAASPPLTRGYLDRQIAEVAKLRAEVERLTEQGRQSSAVIDGLTGDLEAERAAKDEARRELAEFLARDHLGLRYPPRPHLEAEARRVATRNGWDCYRDDP
jgi:septal ring factor EnvC (AmiA/AmiB activator)